VVLIRWVISSLKCQFTCDGSINGIDALDVLLFLTDLPELPLPTGCPAVGQPLS
jgi:hypothetical protein